jgi:hypothetical protein
MEGTKMTKAKKSLALVLVVVLALGLFPMTAFAAIGDGDIGSGDDIKIHDKALTTYPTATLGTDNAINATRGLVELTWAQAHNSMAMTDLISSGAFNATAGKAAQVIRYPAANAADVTDTNIKADLVSPGNHGTAAFTDAVLTDGDVIVIGYDADGSTFTAISAAGDKYWVIDVTVADPVNPTGTVSAHGAQINDFGTPHIIGSGFNTGMLGSLSISQARAANATTAVKETGQQIWYVPSASWTGGSPALNTVFAAQELHDGDYLVVGVDNTSGGAFSSADAWFAVKVTVTNNEVPTSLGVRGVTKTGGWGTAYPVAAANAVNAANLGSIALTPAAAAAGAFTLATDLGLPTGVFGKVYYITSAPTTDASATNDFASQALVVGDWLVIALDTEHPTASAWASTDTIYVVKVTSITATAGDIIGDSTVEFPVLKVVVPANLNFALDPLQQNVIDTNQIAKADYVVVNQTTAAPVQVNFVVVARAKAGVGLVETAEEIDALNPAETAKNIYFGMLAAASASTVPAYAGTGGAYVYDATSVASGSPQVVPFPAASATPISEATAKISFVLEKAASGSTLAADGKGAGAFQFYGNLNTYATWEANDLTVRATYKLVALPANAYASLPKAGLNQYVETPAEAPPPGVHIALKANAVTVPTLTVSRAAFSAKTGAYSGKTGIEIYLYGKPDTDDILNITRGDTDQLFPTSAWTYDGDTGILLVTALPSSGSKIDWTINVKHEADPAYTYEMIISLVS